MTDMETKTVSFGFSKKIGNKKIEKSVVGDVDKKSSEAGVTDFVFALEGKEIHSSVKTDEKKEYVIPLKNTRQAPSKTKSKQAEPVGNNEDSEAIKEIIADSLRQNEEWDEEGTAHQNASIPLLMKRKLDEEEGVSDREIEEADYDEIPLEHFGMAMMRGMGWKDGEGIGKKGKSIAPIEAVLRPKGLGLGADRSQATKLNESKQIPANSKEKDDHLLMKKDTCCVVLKGIHADLYGVIEGIDEDNARVIIKLSLNNQVVTLSQYAVKLVSQKEYDKYSKYINKGKVDKYKKEKESLEANHDRETSRTCKHDTDHESSRHRHKDQSDKDRSGKRRKVEEDQKKYRAAESISDKSNGHSDRVADLLWVRRDIRVRFVDRHYKKGKYYNTKLTVEDVFDKDNCLCKTENGKLLENISQSMLETLIPRSDPGYVVIVCGKYRKQIAQVVNKDKKNCIATLQLLEDRSKVLKLEYDSICEYIGNIEDEFNY